MSTSGLTYGWRLTRTRVATVAQEEGGMEVEVDLNRERRAYELGLWAVTCGGCLMLGGIAGVIVGYCIWG